MIDFEDFFPAITQHAGFLRAQEYEPLRAALGRANEWIAQQGVEVVNVETVVLPEMHDRLEEGTQDPSLRTSGEMSSEWHQFIRVWYRRG